MYRLMHMFWSDRHGSLLHQQHHFGAMMWSKAAQFTRHCHWGINSADTLCFYFWCCDVVKTHAGFALMLPLRMSVWNEAQQFTVVHLTSHHMIRPHHPAPESQSSLKYQCMQQQDRALITQTDQYKVQQEHWSRKRFYFIKAKNTV